MNYILHALTLSSLMTRVINTSNSPQEAPEPTQAKPQSTISISLHPPQAETLTRRPKELDLGRSRIVRILLDNEERHGLREHTCGSRP